MLVKRVTTTKPYTIHELYEAVKDSFFSAGTPSLTKDLFMRTIITFPALDRHNQVWITRAQFKRKCTKWFIMKRRRAVTSIGGYLAYLLLRSGRNTIFSDNAKDTKRLVNATVIDFDRLKL